MFNGILSYKLISCTLCGDFITYYICFLPGHMPDYTNNIVFVLSDGQTINAWRDIFLQYLMVILTSRPSTAPTCDIPSVPIPVLYSDSPPPAPTVNPITPRSTGVPSQNGMGWWSTVKYSLFQFSTPPKYVIPTPLPFLSLSLSLCLSISLYLSFSLLKIFHWLSYYSLGNLLTPNVTNILYPYTPYPPPYLYQFYLYLSFSIPNLIHFLYPLSASPQTHTHTFCLSLSIFILYLLVSHLLYLWFSMQFLWYSVTNLILSALLWSILPTLLLFL